MSDWNSDSDDDSQWMPAVEEYTVTACPDCGKRCEYLLTGCALAYANVNVAGAGYKCHTCGDGTVTCEPCETFGQFDGMIVCACQHGDLRVCMQCCSFTPGERYVQLTRTLKLDIHPVTSYILHTDITKQHANATIATDHNGYHHWCPLKGGKVKQCAVCPLMLIDEGHDGQLCHKCRSYDRCGSYGCGSKIQNSTLGRMLQSCRDHTNEQYCIECKVFFQSRGKKYRCRACNPNNLVECSSCRIGYNH
jgi:hypothetical protein